MKKFFFIVPVMVSLAAPAFANDPPPHDDKHEKDKKNDKKKDDKKDHPHQ